MRRPRSVGEAQGWRTVDRLARKFEYPDERTFPTAPAFGGGGAPTVVVAAADATELSKSKADMVCTGAQDEMVIAAALAKATNPQDGFAGRVLLTEGHFDISSHSFIFVRSGQTLQGLSHRGTHLVYSGGVGSHPDAVIEVQGGGQVIDLRIEESGGNMDGVIGIRASTGTGPAIIKRIEMDHRGRGLFIRPDYSWIENIYMNVDEDAIQLDGKFIQVANSTLIAETESGIVGLSTLVTDIMVRNVRIETFNTAIEISGHDWSVIGCRATIESDFITNPNNRERAIVIGNNVKGSIPSGTDWVVEHNIIDGVPQAGNGGGNGNGGSSASISAFSQAGELEVGSGTFKLPFPLDATIRAVQLAVAASPTGSSLIVDVNKNGTTIFTTQANRPTVPASDADGVGAEAIPDVTSVAQGDYLTVDIDQIGSTVPGEDLTVAIEWSPA